MTSSRLMPDPEELGKFWEAHVLPGTVIEARVLGVRRHGPRRWWSEQVGYFDDREKFIAEVSQVSGADAEGVYATLNPADPALLARSANHLRDAKKGESTAKHNILCLRHLLIDCDPPRPTGIMATAAQRAAAEKRREVVRAFCRAQGWGEPVMAGMSGNGGHLIYRLADLPNDREHETLVKDTLASLSILFSDELVKIDTGVFDPPRIFKIPGTVVAKGDSTAERPWAMATATYSDWLDVEPLSADQLRQVIALADEADEEDGEAGAGAATRERPPLIAGGGAAANVERIRANLPAIDPEAVEGKWDGAATFALSRCLICREDGGNAKIFVWPSGAIGYRCHRNRCTGKRWTDVPDDVRVRLGFRSRAEAQADRQTRDAGAGATEPLGRQAQPEGPRPESIPVPPFPLHVLPRAIRKYCEESAEALGAPVDLVAVPLLALAEGVIGRTRRLVLKTGFEVSPGGWYGCVGEPGTVKSPSMRQAQALVLPLEAAASDRWLRELEAWQELPKDERGARPRREHYFTSDSTLEALADALDASAGVCQLEDELLRRVKALDQYRAGGDRQAMLSMWSNASLKVIRKTTGVLYVTDPVAPLYGGVQPDRLRNIRGDGADGAADDGWVPRLQLSWPDSKVPRWTDAARQPGTQSAAEQVFAALRLRGTAPQDVWLSKEGRQVWQAWYDENAAHVEACTGIERQWASKAPIHCARAILVLHTLNTALSPARHVEADGVRAGIELVEYFRGHLARVLPVIAGQSPRGEGVALRQRVWSALVRADGWVPMTELHAATGRNYAADRLRTVLDALAAAGLAEGRSVATGGRPSDEWRAVTGHEETRRNEESPADEAGAGVSSFLRTPDTDQDAADNIEAGTEVRTW